MRTVSFLALILLLLASCGEGPMANNTAVENFTDLNAMDVNMAADDPANATNDVQLDMNGVEMVRNGAGPAADGRQYCDVIADYATQADCAYYRDISARLESGSAALTAPPQMTRGVPATVEFAIARPPSPDRPAAVTDAEELLTAEPTLTKAIPVGRRMAVQLEGDGFAIEPEGLREADLGLTGAARWQWAVTPTVGGSRRLVLSAYVIVQAPDGTRGQNLIRTMHQDVEVAVAASEQADSIFAAVVKWLGNLKNLLGLLAAVVLAALGVRVAWRKFRKGEAE